MKKNPKETNRETGRDSSLGVPAGVFPMVTVVTASAGAGKTYTITHRYAQILLSEDIPRHGLQNVLAITFTNNAASEMKQRILRLLKMASLGDTKTLEELSSLVSAEDSALQIKATKLLGEIFDDYSNFQVKTIDSFMAAVFKASALEYGYQPDFDILLNTDQLFERAFDLFSRELKANSAQARVVEKLVALISENRGNDSTFLWDPYKDISLHVKEMYDALASQTKPLSMTSLSQELAGLKHLIKSQAAVVSALIKQSSLTLNHNAAKDFELMAAGDIQALITRALKMSPVNKPKGKVDEASYEKWIGQIEREQGKLNELLKNFILCYAKSYYEPYTEAYGLLRESIGRLKKRYGQVFIDDVNKTLAEHLNAHVVPEVYFKIGETIYHYLIDEFQDTSQIQWKNLFLLIEESLSKGGSLFVVGDTKQSIYGFRSADWRIMKELADSNPFPSAHHEVQTLDTNFRSFEKIVDLNKTVFHEVIPSLGYPEEAAASGLSSFRQKVKKEHQGKGYAEVVRLQQKGDGTQELWKVSEIIDECHERGYRYNEIAVLTPNNSDVIRVSGWLSGQDIPIISHSTLDVRRRKSAGELIALLRFLDTPVDDLSFSTFILGDVFSAVLAQRKTAPTKEDLRQFIFEERARSKGPLYVAFRSRFKNVWDTYFEHLLTVVGYLPLYDLLSEVFKILDIFQALPDEEASMVKLLEVVKIFEQEGTNTIKDFLEFSEDEADNEVWKIDVPKNIDALQVMTIHKAKGSEFPVVIVLLYDRRLQGDSYVVHEDESGVRIVKVNKELANKVEELQTIYEERRFRDTVDSFNKLYVALTRAEKEMYIVGVYKKEFQEPSRFLPEDQYRPSEKPSMTRSIPEIENTFESFHHSHRKALFVQEYSTVGAHETKRGDVIHRLLASIECISEDVPKQFDDVVSRLQRELRIENSSDEIRSTVVEFLGRDEVKRLFIRKEGIIILREQELTNRFGALYRADRIVIDAATVTVIDFKTGGNENEAEYIIQVKNYMEILGEIYPDKKVEGLIAYVDLKRTRSVA